MRWPTQKFVGFVLAVALSTVMLAQRGAGGGHAGAGYGGGVGYGGVGFNSAPRGLSSTALGAGARFGPSPLSSTALGAGATLGLPYSSPNNIGLPYSRGLGYAGRNNFRAGYGAFGRRDYRNVPYPFFFSPYYYPFLDYGSSPYPYDGGPQDPGYDPSADSGLVTQNMLGEQVQRLTAELDQMKYAQGTQTGQMMQQGQPMQPPMPSAQSAEPPPPPLTVVLRNGQKLQVENYAVMDQTFWDFSKHPALKIPISTIDVSASSAATAANGGEFPQLEAK